MVDPLLYIFDKTCSVKRFVQYCAKENIRKIFLCPITTDQDVISLLVKSLSSIKNCDAEITPYLKYFHELAFSERDNFIRFVSELGKESRFGSVSLREYFRYPNSSFSVWWLSLISEKDPQKSDTYHSLIKLLTILKLSEDYKCKRIIIDIESRELSCTIMHNSRSLYECNDFKKCRMKPQIVYFLINFLKGLKHYFYSIYKIFIVTLNGRGLDFRKEILKNAKYMAITYFPLIDKESLRQKRFVNKYYGLLQVALENRYKDKLIWLAMAPGIDGFSFKESIKLGRQLNMWNYPIYFLEEWIVPKDLFIIMGQYIYFTIKCIIKLPYLSKKLEYSKNRINIWRLFEEDWFSSFAGGTLMSGIFYYRAFKNISTELKERAVVIYLAENQKWEKALNFAFHDNKGLKVIGILHTTVPLLLLQFFDSREDLRKDSEMVLTMPKPDYLACNGKISWELLQASGWDEKKAFLWFAIRYQHLKRYLQKKIPWERRQNKILVALPGYIKGSKELLRYIYQAFIGQTNYQIIIKGHYGFPVQTLVRGLNLDFKDTFVFSDEDLDSLLPVVKLMVVAGSSMALESIASGCPVIIPRLSSVVDMNPLSEISDLPLYVSSPRELQATVDDIIRRRESPLLYEKCRDFIENYFRFSDSENELIEKIENCFVSEGKIL